MATKNVSVPVKEGFDFQGLISKFSDSYRANGYNVLTNPAFGTQAQKITLEKDNAGANNLLGLGIQESINFTWANGVLNVAFEDECATNRYLALGVGWFLCFVPFVTGLVGMSKHNTFVAGVQTQITNLVMSLNQ